MQAIQTYGLKNYTINLMTMDYGSAGPGNCVVANGTCQMGQSAIQAAMNLHDHWGVPYSQLELTPMIGGNDVAGETFTPADADTTAAFVKQNGLVRTIRLMRYRWWAHWLWHRAVRQAFVMFAAVLRIQFNIISIINIKLCSG
ncbi:hypothetical protein [Burkholderia ubonensis]|uniref:hypothetical protein n=1 Tax=Burkholderia ubonensis TaxID=101571 RepID=UPI00075884A4|nr:hypothetical protein WL08_05915 [Burkholderia ubonensis]